MKMDKFEDLLIDPPKLEEHFMSAMPQPAENDDPNNQVRLTPVTPSKSTMDRLKESQLRGPDGSPLLQVDLAFVYEKIEKPPLVALYMRLPNKFWLDHIVIKNVDIIYGQTGLSAPVIAASTGDLEMTRKYIKCGSDVNLQVKGGNSSLMEATHRGDTETIHVLLEAGADINLQNQEGQTALMVALLADRVDTVCDLLSCGAGVDIQTKRGHTALMLAAWQGQEDAVRHLVEDGNANILLEDQMGLTALCWAELRHPKIAAFLSFALGLQDQLKQFIKERMQRCVFAGRSRLLYAIFWRHLRLLLTFKPARRCLLADDCLRLMTSCHSARSLLRDPDIHISHKIAVHLEPWLLALVCGMMYQEELPYVQFTKDEAACWLLANVAIITTTLRGCEFLDCMLVALLAAEKGRSWLHDTALQVREMCGYLATVADRTNDLRTVFTGMMQRLYDRYHLKEQKQALSNAARHALVPEPPQRVGQILTSVKQRYAELAQQASNKCKDLEERERESAKRPPMNKKDRRRRTKPQYRHRRFVESADRAPVGEEQYIISPKENPRDIEVHSLRDQGDLGGVQPQPEEGLKQSRSENLKVEIGELREALEKISISNKPEGDERQDDNLATKPESISCKSGALEADAGLCKSNNAPVLKAGNSENVLLQTNPKEGQFQCENHSWPSLLEAVKQGKSSNRPIRRSQKNKITLPCKSTAMTHLAVQKEDYKEERQKMTSSDTSKVQPSYSEAINEVEKAGSIISQSKEEKSKSEAVPSEQKIRIQPNVNIDVCNENKLDSSKSPDSVHTSQGSKNTDTCIASAESHPERSAAAVLENLQDSTSAMKLSTTELDPEHEQEGKLAECTQDKLDDIALKSDATQSSQQTSVPVPNLVPPAVNQPNLLEILARCQATTTQQSTGTFSSLFQGALKCGSLEALLTLPGLLLVAQMQQHLRLRQQESVEVQQQEASTKPESNTTLQKTQVCPPSHVHPSILAGLPGLPVSLLPVPPVPMPVSTGSHMLNPKQLLPMPKVGITEPTSGYAPPPPRIRTPGPFEPTLAIDTAESKDLRRMVDQHNCGKETEGAGQQTPQWNQNANSLTSPSALCASPQQKSRFPPVQENGNAIKMTNQSSQPCFPASSAENSVTPVNTYMSSYGGASSTCSIPVATVAPVSYLNTTTASVTAERTSPAVVSVPNLYMPSIHETFPRFWKPTSPGIAWCRRSSRWRRHLQDFVELPAGKRKRLGNFYVCDRDEKFVIKRGPLGTQVLLGLHVDGTELAVKKMLRAYYVRVEQTLSAFKQANTELADKYVLSVKDTWSDMYFGYIATELLEENLEERVKDLEKLGLLEAETPGLIQGLLSALQHLQHSRLPHLCLKPSNILFDMDARLRLSDVQIGTHANSKSSYGHSKEALCWRSKEAIAEGEQDVMDKPYCPAWDSQVAGMLIHYIVTGGRHPFGTDVTQCEQYITKDQPDISALTDPALSSLVRRLLEPNATTRLPPSQALRHPYFWKPWETLLFLAAVGQLPVMCERGANPFCTRINLTLSGPKNRGMAPALFAWLQKKNYRGSLWCGNTVCDLLRFLAYMANRDHKSLLAATPWVTENCQSLVPALFDIVREEGYIASTEHILAVLKKAIYHDNNEHTLAYW